VRNLNFLFIYFKFITENFTNLLLVPPAVATETSHHEVVTLLRQELRPVPAIQHKQNKGTQSQDAMIYIRYIIKKMAKMFRYDRLEVG
jgi:hypothetical protein